MTSRWNSESLIISHFAMHMCLQGTNVRCCHLGSGTSSTLLKILSYSKVIAMEFIQHFNIHSFKSLENKKQNSKNKNWQYNIANFCQSSNRFLPCNIEYCMVEIYCWIQCITGWGLREREILFLRIIAGWECLIVHCTVSSILKLLFSF